MNLTFELDLDSIKVHLGILDQRSHHLVQKLPAHTQLTSFSACNTEVLRGEIIGHLGLC